MSLIDQMHLDRSLIEYRKNNKFIDIMLNGIPAHKIILAKFSKYFKEYFVNHETKENIFTFDLKFNPENCFDQAIELIYDLDFHYSEKLIIPLLSVTEFYGIDQVKFKLNNDLKLILNSSNAIDFAKQSKNYHFSDVDQIVDVIVQNINMYDQQSIITSVSVEALTKILKSPNLHFTDDQKISWVDKFDEIYPIKNESDKYLLKTIVDFDQPDSFKLLINHRCMWLPSKILKTLLQKLMNVRRLISNHYNNYICAIDQEVISRWYLFSIDCDITNLISDIEIRDPDSQKQGPQVEAISFCNTLGHFIDVSEINNFKESFICMKSDNDTFDYFGPKRIVNGNPGHFLVYGHLNTENQEEVSQVSITIDLGPKALFKVDQCIINCLDKDYFDHKKKLLENETIESTSSFYGVPIRLKVDFSSEDGHESSVFVVYHKEHPANVDVSKVSFPIRKMTIDLCAPNAAKQYVLRIQSVQLIGRFIPHWKIQD